MTAPDMLIRHALERYARLSIPVSSLRDTQDLYRAGMTSHASLDVMLALEERLKMEFPERLVRRSTFASIASIRAAIAQVTA